jgi:hypothetical protein
MLATVRRIPLLIALLFAADLMLVLIPALDYAIGRPINRLSILFILDKEGTVPTWHSSMQWFCASAMFTLFAAHALLTGMKGALSVTALALACLVFSIDEIAQIHERLGSVADDMMIDRPLRGPGLWATGLWPVVVGIPAIAVIAIIVRGTRHVFLPRAARSLALLSAGLAVMLTGAVVVELGVNLLDEAGPRDSSFLAQVVVEELMEMLGATLVVWSASSLLHAYGFRLRMPPARPRRAHGTARPATAAGALLRRIWPAKVTSIVPSDSAPGTCHTAHPPASQTTPWSASG